MIEGVTFRVTHRTSLRETLEIETPPGRPNVPAKVEITPANSGYRLNILRRSPCPSIKATSSRCPSCLPERSTRRWRRSSQRGGGAGRSVTCTTSFGLGRDPSARPSSAGCWFSRSGTTSCSTGWGRDRSMPPRSWGISTPTDLRWEGIGLLTQPVEPARWLASVQDRYTFVTELDSAEVAISRMQPSGPVDGSATSAHPLEVGAVEAGGDPSTRRSCKG